MRASEPNKLISSEVGPHAKMPAVDAGTLLLAVVVFYLADLARGIYRWHRKRHDPPNQPGFPVVMKPADVSAGEEESGRGSDGMITARRKDGKGKDGKGGYGILLPLSAARYRRAACQEAAVFQ